MKKAVSVILCISILFSLSLSINAQGEKCNCGIDPVVYVHGFGSYPLYEQSGGKSVQVFPPNAQSIIKSLPVAVGLIMNLTVTKQYKRCADEIIKLLENMMGRLACDSNGDSLYDVTFEKRELPTEDRHRVTDYSYNTQADDFNEKSQYSYYYDFRLDPVSNAEGLNTYIKYVKDLTHHDKVKIVCHSQGNTVVASYLAKYKNADVSRVIFLSPAYKGLSLIGKILNEDLNLRGKADDLELYFKGILGFSPASEIIGALISLLNDYGALPYLTEVLQNLVDDQFEYILNTELLKVFGTMPAIWSFCPDEYYESAKENMFGGSDEYAGLIKKIDHYHYNIQNKLVSIINECSARGMTFAISCGYDISTIPVSGDKQSQTDMLIDTEYMSIGANCSQPDCCFDSEYVNKSGNSRYISPDRKIDASSCSYPDRTWFIKGQRHDDFYDDYTEFITSLLLCKDQPTVDNLKDYSQFMCYDDDMKLIPVSSPDIPDTRSDEVIIADTLFELLTPGFIKSLFEKRSDI